MDAVPQFVALFKKNESWRQQISMDMTPSLFFKLVVLLGFVPLSYLGMLVAQRKLPDDHPVRLWIERVGVEKLARYAFLAVWAIGGVWLALAFS